MQAQSPSLLQGLESWWVALRWRLLNTVNTPDRRIKDPNSAVGQEYRLGKTNFSFTELVLKMQACAARARFGPPRVVGI